VPARALHHVDLAVTDVERSVAFYNSRVRPCLRLMRVTPREPDSGSVGCRAHHLFLVPPPAVWSHHLLLVALSSCRARANSRSRWRATREPEARRAGVAVSRAA
jgi:catechol 2,3-dioxygenase-like lactoylglutathione lyase family enzyme